MEQGLARILIVEDESNLRFSIAQTLKRAGHTLSESDSVSEAWELTRSLDFDAILTDVNLGSENGIEFVGRLREDGFEGPIVVMTAFGTVESAVAAMKRGADDYLQKPLSLEELTLLVERLLENRKLKRQLNLYRRMESSHEVTAAIIGESAPWRQTLKLAERLANAPIPTKVGGNGHGGHGGGGSASGGALPTVLILGETGTGKGVLARYIHHCVLNGSKLRPEDAPFVHVNCSALPPSLVESELFGHEKGAFTDAKSHRVGLFEMAEGGTIFLDEIGDMPLDLQAKILTVVEEGTYRRVGGSRDKSVRARVIAATNQPLEERVNQGKFRRDLLYRLNALTVRIPPLRDRGGDAVLIASSMLERFGKEYGRAPGPLGWRVLLLSEASRSCILAHDWPGNVRELINVCQRVAMLAEGPEVLPEDLGLGPRPSIGDPGSLTPLDLTGAGVGSLRFDFERGVHKAEDVERELLVQALQRSRGNVSKAAKLIGMQRSSFRYRIDRYGLQNLVQEIANR
jgi:two-component system, NtrC family, response regulator AtoC